MLKLQVLSAQNDIIHVDCEGDVTLATVPTNENPLADALVRLLHQQSAAEHGQDRVSRFGGRELPDTQS